MSKNFLLLVHNGFYYNSKNILIILIFDLLLQNNKSLLDDALEHILQGTELSLKLALYYMWYILLYAFYCTVDRCQNINLNIWASLIVIYFCTLLLLTHSLLILLLCILYTMYVHF